MIKGRGQDRGLFVSWNRGISQNDSDTNMLNVFFKNLLTTIYFQLVVSLFYFNQGLIFAIFL